MQRAKLGLSIGNVYVGCPTCADDIALLSNDVGELQSMLSVLHRHAQQDRVTIHPTKTKAVVFHKAGVIKSTLTWKLGEAEISPTNQTVHLGIIRSELKENDLNIEDRISLARRTLYSLINTGLHGTNGINPMVAYKMYQSYVLPKLLYGIELIPLNKTQLSQISRFHIGNLRRFQSLPSRSASAIVYLLLGALPIEAEIHKRQLSLLYSIISCDNDTIRRLLERQVVMQSQNLESFFGHVTETLFFYDLPTINILKENLPLKLSWKKQYKQSILETWSRILQVDLSGKSSVKYLNKKL